MPEDSDAISKALVLAKPKDLTFLTADPLPPPPNSIYTDCCSLLFCLTGHFRVRHARGSEDIRPRDCMVCLPGSWRQTRALSPTTSQLLACLFHTDHTRLVVMPMHSRRRCKEADKRYYHTPGAGTHLAQAISLLQAIPELNVQGGTDLLHIILALLRNSLTQDPLPPQGSARQTWLAIRSYVQDHLHENIDRNSAARQFALNPSYISRLFSSHGESFNSYLNRLRLEKAVRLLQNSDCSVATVAKRCGFSSAGYFTTVCRRQLACTPSQLRA